MSDQIPSESAKSKPITFGDPEADTKVPIFIKGVSDAIGAIIHYWGEIGWHVHIVTVDAAQPLFSVHLENFKTLEDAKAGLLEAGAQRHSAHPIEKNLEEESKEKKSPSSPQSDLVRLAFDYYNAKAIQNGWRKADLLNGPRRQKIRKRLKDAGDIIGWWAVIDRIEKSRFLMGKIEGRDGRAFKMHLDFVLQESSFTKLREGFYDDPDPATPKFRPL